MKPMKAMKAMKVISASLAKRHVFAGKAFKFKGGLTKDDCKSSTSSLASA